MPSLVIRPATPADAGLIVDLIRALAEYEKMLHLVVATEELVGEHLFGERRYAQAILAEWEGRPAGFALFFYNYSTFLCRPGIYLEDLFVYPEFRGKGIGKQLLAHVAQLAVKDNCWQVEWTVLDWNEPALGFYRKLGAKPLDDWIKHRLSGQPLQDLAATAISASAAA